MYETLTKSFKMKKIFISALALTVASCSLFERNDDNYWLNHVRNYSTYPVNYYSSGSLNNSEKVVESSEIATHTFKRNVVVSANVGQRMVDSQTFRVNKFSRTKVMAQQDAVISSANNEISIRKGQEFIPAGEVVIDGIYYALIRLDDDGSILLMDERGYVQNKLYGLYKGELMPLKLQTSIHPNGLRMVPTDTFRTAVDAPKQNFEIKYDGFNNGMAEVTYIGYDENGNPHAQKYIIPQGQNFVDINGVKMQVTGVYPDRIEYMLLD